MLKSYIESAAPYVFLFIMLMGLVYAVIIAVNIVYYIISYLKKEDK